MDPSSYQSSWTYAPVPVVSTSESQPWYSTLAPEPPAAVPLGNVTNAPSPNVSGSEPISPLNTLGFGSLPEFGSSEQKLNRDGLPAKRRGPKPDNKPAMTRRQALNRQAQRTHRQKKENYIKALEQQHTLLKSAYTEAIRDREAIVAENRMLKSLLRANNIAFQDRDHNAALNFIDALSISEDQQQQQSPSHAAPINRHLDSYVSTPGLAPGSNTATYFQGQMPISTHTVPSQNQPPLQQPGIPQLAVPGYSGLGVEYGISQMPQGNYFEDTSQRRSQGRQSSTPTFLQQRTTP